MADSQLEIKVPQQLIEDLVRAAVVRELGGQEKLIEGVVNAAIKAKDHSYDKQTIFQREVQRMIQEVAKESVKEWIDLNRESIRASFVSSLMSNDGQIVKALLDDLISNVTLRPSITIAWDVTKKSAATPFEEED